MKPSWRAVKNMQIIKHRFDEIAKRVLQNTQPVSIKPSPQRQTEPIKKSNGIYGGRVSKSVYAYLLQTAKDHAIYLPQLLSGCVTGEFRIRNKYSGEVDGVRECIVKMKLKPAELIKVWQLMRLYKVNTSNPVFFAVAVALGQFTLNPLPEVRLTIDEEEILCALGKVLDFTEFWVLQSSVKVGTKSKWLTDYWTMRQEIDFAALKIKLDTACENAQARLLASGRQPHDLTLAEAIPNLLGTLATDIAIDVHYSCVGESTRKLLYIINQICEPAPNLSSL